MDEAEEKTPAPGGADAGDHPMGVFNTTHWSVVTSAGAVDTKGRIAAFEQLYRTYRYPIYWFIRRHRGYKHEDAEDLTQSFFAHLLKEETLERATRERGKFRTFLLGVLVKLLANEWDRRQAKKRGGGCQTVSIDEAVAEGFYGREPVEKETPERVFDRVWAGALIGRVLERLRTEYSESGKADLFTALEPALPGSGAGGAGPEATVKLGLSEGAARVALSRLRARFRVLLRNEVAQTVSTPNDVDAELRYLMTALLA